MTVGRHQTNDLVLSDPAVSLVHLEARRLENGGVLVKDSKSKNGVWLAGNRLLEAELAPDTVLQIGSTLLKADHGGSDTELSTNTRFGGLVGQSLVMRELFAMLEKVATRNLAVLIEGETGTGKEEVARAIHAHSSRKDKPFVVLDATSIPPTLAESILFGHEKGAFTGAHERSQGVFEQANGGTVFLDEVGELPLELQPKLLRVLERREVVRLSGQKPIPVDVRLIAATLRDLRHEVERSRFRDDLYFRLAQVRLVVPPLRSRLDDIGLLAQRFLCQCGESEGHVPALAPEALDELKHRPWLGNVRELKNVLLRAAALCNGNVIRQDDVLGTSLLGSPKDDMASSMLEHDFLTAKGEAVRKFERIYLQALMHKVDGNLSQAARHSRLARHHLRELLRKHGLYEPPGD